ncbi:MAG TPA: hypothetical protein VKT54_11710 [Steroidobacteraceae bacterium]|nr:hypothetical protein [Steroidobacteraceae bacterium]
MVRRLLACCFALGASATQAAAIPGSTYGHELLLAVSRANPQLLAASISARPPKAAEAVVVASTDPQAALGRSDAADLAASASATPVPAVSPSGERLEVRLPLHDVSGDTIGTLHLSYAYQPGGDRAALERRAESVRDFLQRRISHAANLLDPYPFEPDAPSHTYAQQLVDEFLERYPQIEILAIHATPPDSDYNIIAGSNIGRLGKKADNDDMRCVFTGKPNLELNSSGKRFESEMQLHDRAGTVIGAVGVVFAYRKGDDKEALHERAEKIKAELEKRIPDSAALFRPAAAH